jgi:demethylmenaquinone methyltransferase/2-methoxy-6-polyprenyl-1,4-benzoquinol methylase
VAQSAGVSSLALMRWLESSPGRYDAGMRWLTLGRVARLHDALADAVGPGARVLEIGCGTGAVTEKLVARGAEVTALDQDPEMLDRARRRLAGRPGVTWLERSAAEIDGLPEAGFDAVVASLCLSEMSPGERGFVLRQVARRLRRGGLLAVADEVRPRGWRRAAFALARAPQAALAWLLAGSTSRPIADLAGEIAAAGLAVRRERRWLAGSLAAILAVREA